MTRISQVGFWLTHSAHKLDDLVEDERLFVYLGIDIVLSMKTPVQDSTVRITMDFESEKGALYLATDKFGIIELKSGKSYFRVEVTELAMHKMNTMCINTMEKNDALIKATNNVNQKRLY